MNINNISAKTIARIAAAEPMSHEHGEAVAQAMVEAQSAPSIKPGQMVTVNGINARVMQIASNGAWILRAATQGEWIRTGQDQIRERVSIKALTAA